MAIRDKIYFLVDCNSSTPSIIFLKFKSNFEILNLFKILLFQIFLIKFLNLLVYTYVILSNIRFPKLKLLN